MSLEHKSNAQIRSLSGGMKRRLTFVRALLSDPELLILDEPTTGLDPTVRHLLWDKVLSYRQAGKTVLVTTHYMHEAELLCDRVIILNHGVEVAVGSPKELIEKETPGFVGIFEADQANALKMHLDSRLALFHASEAILRPRTANSESFRFANRLRSNGDSNAPGKPRRCLFEADRRRIG